MDASCKAQTWIGIERCRTDKAGRRSLHRHETTRAGGNARGSLLARSELNIRLGPSFQRTVPIHVGALKESASNRFYERHGFLKTNESEWDIYYVRSPVRKADSI